MVKKLKKVLVIVVCISLFAGFSVSGARNDLAVVSEGVSLALSSQSYLLMEASTGEIMYEHNSREHLEPASVTKVMSLLLVCEALEEEIISLEDMVTGSEKAASMGGSQIWLENGESLSVNDMLKAMVVVSANDCTVAMAEHLAGSEEAFVERMNKRAKELGMNDTNFVNATGLPAENHYTCANDIALMTCELLKHDVIFNYTNIWMDSLRGGEMGLSNTNKLIRFYQGANGMKTGYTDSAKYCLSATAKRDGMQLVAVVMKAPSSDERFADAKKLLDFGFANYSVYNSEMTALPMLRVKGGIKKYTPVSYGARQILVAKGREKKVETYVIMPDSVKAPVKSGDVVGKVEYRIGEEVVGETDVVASEDIKCMGVMDVLRSIAAVNHK